MLFSEVGVDCCGKLSADWNWVLIELNWLKMYSLSRARFFCFFFFFEVLDSCYDLDFLLFYVMVFLANPEYRISVLYAFLNESEFGSVETPVASLILIVF